MGGLRVASCGESRGGRRIGDAGLVPTGKKHGITELHPDVVSYVSHATQQRLQNLVEKVSETAQQKNFSYKVPAVPGPLAVPQAPHCHLSGPLLFPQGPSLPPPPCPQAAF